MYSGSHDIVIIIIRLDYKCKWSKKQEALMQLGKLDGCFMKGFLEKITVAQPGVNKLK